MGTVCGRHGWPTVHLACQPGWRIHSVYFLTRVLQVGVHHRVLLSIWLKILCRSRRKPPSFGGVLPGLASVRAVLTGAPMLDDSRASGLRELREEHALVGQRRR